MDTNQKQMSNILDEVKGESLVLEVLNNLDAEHLSIEESLELMCSIFRDNLSHFLAKENVHNAGKIASLLSVKLFPSHPSLPLNKIRYQRYQEASHIEFTDEPNFEYAILRACAVLLWHITKANPSEGLSRSAERLHNYIESIGALPEDYIE